MNILQICNKIPYPPQDGGAIAMNNITNSFINSGHKVKILAVTSPKHSVKIEELPEDYVNKTKIELEFINTDVKATAAFLNLFSCRSYNIQRFYSIKFENKLTKTLKENNFDIIQFESIFLVSYLKTVRKHSNAKIVLRAHNVEHRIWERMAMTEKSFLKRRYIKLLAKRLKKVEIAESNNVDSICTVTQNDLEIFRQNGCKVPMTVIPIGIDVTKESKLYKTEVEFPSIFHIGAMDWMPNIEAVNWFLDNVWDEVHKQFPELKFYLAGRNTPEWLLKLNKPNVEVLGEVESAGEFISAKAIMIVPLLSGSGMRVKIIEGMMLGKAIITTSIGIEGIEATNNENVLIANTALEFVEAISKCVIDKEFCIKLGENAKAHAGNVYDNVKLTEKLDGFIHSLVGV
ncbi:MAG: glycosyltransferase family 4 protein [Saprospiraceae bacterium]|nr:glycosyltransferase family 4 protein [Saprospiraceae bacterium]